MGLNNKDEALKWLDEVSLRQQQHLDAPRRSTCACTATRASGLVQKVLGAEDGGGAMNFFSELKRRNIYEATIAAMERTREAAILSCFCMIKRMEAIHLETMD